MLGIGAFDYIMKLNEVLKNKAPSPAEKANHYECVGCCARSILSKATFIRYWS